MDKELKELMQISVVGENILLSEMVKDIVPKEEQIFTNLELEADKKKEFSVVIYKKQNPFISFLHSIKLALEKARIIKHSKDFELDKISNK